MGEHPYRTAPTRRAGRAKTSGAVVAIGAVWLAAVACTAVALFDHELAPPITGLSCTLAVLVPVIVSNARALAAAFDQTES